MAESSRYASHLQRVNDLQSKLRSCIEQCEPCAFQIRDVHNAIISTVKPLIETQQALLTSGSKCGAALRDVHSLAKTCSASATALQSDILAVRSTQGLAGELASALEKLRSQPVDPAFIGGESGHTLYDFVDESSVDSLQQQLQGELNEMEAIYRSCYATINSFDQQIRYLNGLLGSLMPVAYPSGAEDTSAVDAVGVLMTALKERCTLPTVDAVELMPLQVLMQNWKTYAMELEVSVVSLASSVSQVENIQTRLAALRDRGQHRTSGVHANLDTGNLASSMIGSTSPGTSSAAARSRTQSDSVVDLFGRVQLGSASTASSNSPRTASTDAFSDRAEEEFRHLLTELESCERIALERIRVGDALAQGWEGRMQEFNVIRWCARATKNLQDSALQRMRGAAVESDRIIQATHERRAPFDEGIRRFAVLKQSVDSLRQELTSLSYFYQEFATAYTGLQTEMTRRHEAITTLKATIQQAEDTLRSFSTTEADARRQFLEQYGQFLPVSLCPEVQDPSPTFEIIPSLAEALKRIPVPSAPAAPQAPTTDRGDNPPDALIPTIREPANKPQHADNTQPQDAKELEASPDGESSGHETIHQPKPRRMLQGSVYGSDLPSTVVFSPSPARGAASPLEVPPFAMSPAANPLPDLLQLIESLDGNGPAVTDRFHFSDDVTPSDSDNLPPPVAPDGTLLEPQPAARTLYAAITEATRTGERTGEQQEKAEQDRDGSDWVDL